MTGNDDVEREFRSWLAREAPSREPLELFDAIAAASATVRQYPGLLVAVRGGGLVARRTRRFGLTVALAALVLLLVATVVAGSRPTTRVPPGGIFSPAGSMSEPRQGHTATLLTDGRILVIGGLTYTTDSAVNVPTVEVWDPATRSFSSDGSIPAGLVGHTATLLDDGRVLVIGGSASEGLGAAAALIWDPGTASSAPTGSMNTARSGHTATRLSDGRVLVLGGASDGRPAQTAEIWDPGTGTFTPTGAPAVGRTGHTATLLPDDRVLVIGGGNTLFDHTYLGLTSAEIWDPASATFRPTGSLAVGRANHSATLLDDGRVLVVGGGDAPPEDMEVRAAEIWDPTTETFATIGAPAFGRANHTATLLDDGRVLVVGSGGYRAGEVIGPTELWDPRTETFGSAATLIDGRASHTATLLDDGRVLVLGGAGQPYPLCPNEAERCMAPKQMRVALSSTEIYEPGR